MNYQTTQKRLSWKKIMGGMVVTGPDYWSNGHFALYNTVPMPEAINKLKDIFPRDTEGALDALITSQERTPTDKEKWEVMTNEFSGIEQIITEHGQRFQKIYITMLEKLIPDYSLQLTGDMYPALIYSKGVMVGLLMPLRGE